MAALLTPEQMGMADKLTIGRGPFSGLRLMQNAGGAVAKEILSRYPGCQDFTVLAGPGNNGGDGYVVADLLARAGARVTLYAMAAPKRGTDAFAARELCSVRLLPLEDYVPQSDSVIVDALFGAGLDRAITGTALDAIAKTKAAGSTVVAIDLPSGISGASGAVLGDAFEADLTVTFFRKKPGHVLYPGRALCGQLVVADIGIREDLLDEIGVALFENSPDLWMGGLPAHGAGVHKYARGAVAVFSGGPSSTGAARLSAAAAARTGAGAVTVLSPPSAIMVNASHLTSIMLAAVENLNDLHDFLSTGKTASLVIGPGFGTGKKLREFALAALSPEMSVAGKGRGIKAVVLDADALTEFADNADELFRASSDAPQFVIMTPHEAEFARLFPDISANAGYSKPERAVRAAERSGAVVLLKGPDTVVASPEGRCAINVNGNVNLATAGSGDVLSGIVASLAAQGMKAWETACAAAWLHAEAGRIAGYGAIAEDLAECIPDAFGTLQEYAREKSVNQSQ